MNKKIYVLIGICILIAGGWWINNSTSPLAEMVKESLPEVVTGEQKIYTATIAGADDHYSFGVTVPSGWRVEAVPAIEAINFYDPSANGASNLEKSQVFVRYFNANRFLTLTTVDILNQRNLEVVGRPAVEYEIVKKSGVANFANQPSWRSQQHIVTDVRVSDGSPSNFYVIAKNPELSDVVYQKFLTSLQLNPRIEDISWVDPIAEWEKRVTKKPFGIYITPATSPVQPENFEGYHTAMDVEYGDIEDKVPVYAIGNGRVVIAKAAQGYGGVIVIDHRPWAEVYSLYGHVDTNSLPKVGSVVSAGEQIDVLAAGFSRASGGERKHLHFGVITNTQPLLAGYVANKSELTSWLDPATILD